MTDPRCPDCGASVSPTAIVCPQCGFPIRQNAMPLQGGRPGGSSGTAAIVIGLVVGGFVVVVMFGILAALAIPRFTAASDRAKEMQGRELLKWAYTAEQVYFAEHSVYTLTEAQLTDPARPPVQGLRRYTLQISAASDRELCLEAVPTITDARALSMDENGLIYRSAGCSGAPDYGVVSRSGSDDGARQMLREVHEGIVAYRAAHDGRNPGTLSDVTTRVHDTPAGAEYMVTLPRADEYGVCVAAIPRSPASGLAPLSVDQDGYIYAGGGCTGPALEEPSASPAAEGGASNAPAAKETKPLEKP